MKIDTLKIATDSYNRWLQMSSIPMSKAIAFTSLQGDINIWLKIFENEPRVLREIHKVHPSISFKERIKDRIARRKCKKIIPTPPRYDEVFFNGLKELNNQ